MRGRKGGRLASRARRSTEILGQRLAGLRTLGRSHVEIDGVRLALGPELSLRMRGVLARGSYEAAERRVLARTLEDDDRVLEIGTGVGLLAVLCARRLASDRVHTFEANPALEPLIRRNFALNGVSPSLAIAILAEGEGTRTFHVPRDFWAGSEVPHARWRGAPGHLARSSKPVAVPTRPLHETLTRLRPTFLVVDTEGGEAELARIWDLGGVRKLLVEVHAAAIGREAVAAVERSIEAQGLRNVPELSFGHSRFFAR